MTTNYERGARVEGRVVALLRDLGYEARRAAGSHGIYDVVAFNSDGFVLVQCKSTEARTPSGYDEALDKLAALVVPQNTLKVLAIWQHGKGWYAWVDAKSRQKMSLTNLRWLLPIWQKDTTRRG